MSEARRGQIWLADSGVPVGHEQGKVRPALVVSADSWNGHASTLTVRPITRTSHDFPTRIELESTAQRGLDGTSYARCEEMRAISERHHLRPLGWADPLVMFSMSRTLRLFLEA